LTLFAAAALACGQTSGSGPATAPTPATRAQMQVNRLGSLLNLPEAQKTSAVSIYTTAYTTAQTAQTNLHTAQTSLREAIKANNSALIDQLSATIGQATTQVASLNAKADAAFYALLTADQKAIYDARGGGRGRGPGGMGGPGGGGGGFGPRGGRG
jgi:Spy/CpxP family protein refolding chaperone